MKLSLRHKIISANLIVLILTFLVISVVVIEGLDAVNHRMLLASLIHQADISVISIKQSLLVGEDASTKKEEFIARARDFASKLSGESGMRVMIFSGDKTLAADSAGEKQEKAVFKELDEVLKGNRTHTIRSLNGDRFLYFAFPVMLAGEILGEVMYIYPLKETDASTANIRLLFLLAFGAGLLVILGASLLLSSRITGPILKLRDSAREISGGNFGHKIKITSSDEVGELAAAFNSMSGEIEHRVGIINIEKAKLNSVLESMGEGVVALDGNNAVLAVNGRARLILGDCISDELRKIASKARMQQSRVIVETGWEDRSLLVCATPLPLDEGPDGVVLVLNDVTELRLLQEKQRQFVTNVSHELKTPLTTIIGYVDLLHEKGGDREVFDTSVQYLKSAGDRLLKLVEDLIDLSALNKFEFDIEPRSTDISTLVRDIVGQMSLKAQKFNIRIYTELPGERLILADPARIKQAVVNVLDNAIKYSPGGKITLSLSEQPEFLRLDIRDTGCGIPADMLDMIFEPFYRVDKARSRNLGGNGLGLSITKEIIEKHGGRVLIESTEGVGTCISLLLPV